MKKSKILTAILIICLICSLTFVLVACGGNNDDNSNDGGKNNGNGNGNNATHTHNWQSEYSTNGMSHWFSCTACDDKKDEQAHNLSIMSTDKEAWSECSVCKYSSDKIPFATDLEYDLSEDEQSYIVVGIENKAVTKIAIPSTYNNLPVTAIGEEAFADCNTIAEIILSNSVTEINYNAFYNCSSLTKIALSENLKSIGESAFDACSSLTYIVIPDGVVSIGDFAFDSCEKLVEIIIPNSVKSIGASAFAFCDNLAKITIGSGVETIGEKAFEFCEKLESIDFKGTKAEWLAITKASDWDTFTGKYAIHCTDGKIDKNSNEVA